MWNRKYDVIMQISIGVRYGAMLLTVDTGNVDGILDILKKANPFHGKINENGSCRINGKLTTERESYDLSGLASGPSSKGEGDLKR